MVRKIYQDEIEHYYYALYRPYIEELKKVGGGDGMPLPLLTYHICQGDLEFFVFDEDKGFALTEYVKHLEMTFLMEFYVKPGYRRRGIGREAFNKMDFRTPIFFTVFRANSTAMSFWEVITEGWHDIEPTEEQVKFAKSSKLFCIERGN